MQSEIIVSLRARVRLNARALESSLRRSIGKSTGIHSSEGFVSGKSLLITLLVMRSRLNARTIANYGDIVNNRHLLPMPAYGTTVLTQFHFQMTLGKCAGTRSERKTFCGTTGCESALLVSSTFWFALAFSVVVSTFIRSI